MARALIIGCGCRGRELGKRLAAEGWAVRGTSRRDDGLAPIEAAGIEAAVADPDRVGTVIEQLADVAVVYFLMGSATGTEAELDELHRHRLERLMEKVVDTPVRGVVYEAAGSVEPTLLATGTGIVRTAAATWHIPVEIVNAEPQPVEPWVEAMAAAATAALRSR
jgi:nucleoside-diphosphate-sugar epimerase